MLSETCWCQGTHMLHSTIPQFSQNRYRRKIFSSSGLMRMRLSPLSGDRMVISTMNGFLMVIHDLDLETLEDDLKGFKPNLYRLMQARMKDSPPNNLGGGGVP